MHSVRAFLDTIQMTLNLMNGKIQIKNQICLLIRTENMAQMPSNWSISAVPFSKQIVNNSHDLDSFYFFG